MSRILVLGGGIIGAAIAYRVHALTGHEVQVLLPPDCGVRHLRSTAGLLGAQMTHAMHPDHLELRSLLQAKETTLQFLDELESKTGHSIDQPKRGCLLSGYGDKAIRGFGDIAIRHRQMGFEAHVLDPLSIRDVEPQLGPDLAGGVFFPHTSSLRADQLFESLEAALTLSNIPVFENIEPLGIESENGTFRALRAREETFEADALIVADFPGAPSLLNQIRVRLPLVPLPTTTLEFASSRQAPSRNAQIGNLTIGVSSQGLAVEWQHPGGDPKRAITLGEMEACTAALSKTYPSMTQQEVLSWKKTVRLATQDGAPIYGTAPNMKGLFLALGHRAGGILYTGAAAHLMGRAVTNMEFPEWSRPFWLDRFVPTGNPSYASAHHP